MSHGWELGFCVLAGVLFMAVGCVYLGVRIGKWMIRGGPS